MSKSRRLVNSVRNVRTSISGKVHEHSNDCIVLPIFLEWSTIFIGMERINCSWCVTSVAPTHFGCIQHFVDQSSLSE
jgi:hypothetical protein